MKELHHRTSDYLKSKKNTARLEEIKKTLNIFYQGNTRTMKLVKNRKISSGKRTRHYGIIFLCNRSNLEG